MRENMRIKKLFFGSGLALLLIFLSGCSGETGTAGLSSGLNNTKQVIQQEQMNNSSDLNNNANNMSSNAPTAPVINQDLIKKYPFALIKTSLGEIKVKFSGETAPLTVTNFLLLAQNNFYANTKFHRVIKGFMIQAGDPLSKNATLKDSWGTGGPGYKFKDELTGTETYPQGTLAMANSGPNTNGSQFFIVTASPEAQLPPSYTVFGQVVSGMDVALKIENVKTGASDRPVENVVITSIEPLEKL